jgi:hypothetical protein
MGRLAAILAALPPPPPPDLNPLGALASASSWRRTERMLADLGAALNRPGRTGTADVLPLRREEEAP